MRHVLALSLAGLLFTACAHAPLSSEHPRLLVTTEWLEEHLGDKSLTIVDVGDVTAFEKGHIPGARLIARKDLTVERNGVPGEMPDDSTLENLFSAAGVPDSGSIVIYARELVPAARAFFTLEYAGRRGSCALLDGMFAKWSAEKRPVETGPPAPKTATFKVKADTRILVDLDSMKRAVAAAGTTPTAVAIVDSRPAKNFEGTEAGEGITRGGHIPSAVSVPWTMNLTAGTTPVFKPAGELRSLYHENGVADDAAVVSYCRTGMQASVTYFALRLLGRDVNLYDGSFIEWSRVADTAVVSSPATPQQ